MSPRQKENKNESEDDPDESMTVLDPKHPVYNFLVEYYGLKGLKGPKRLARWSPSISLLLFNVRTLEYNEDDDEDGIDDNTDITNDDDTTTTTSTSTSTSKTRIKIKTITSIQELNDASSFAFISNNGNDIDIDDDCILGKENDGIFLEGATPDDFALILHLKGAEWIEDASSTIFGNNNNNHQRSGVLYRPFRCYNDVAVVDDDNDDDTDNIHDVIAGTLETVISSSSNYNNNNYNTNHNKISSYIWYKSILETTIQSEPILHCYGLHEWAMQYHPFGAEKPPSVRCFLVFCFVYLHVYSTFTVFSIWIYLVCVLFCFLFSLYFTYFFSLTYSFSSLLPIYCLFVYLG